MKLNQDDLDIVRHHISMIRDDWEALPYGQKQYDEAASRLMPDLISSYDIVWAELIRRCRCGLPSDGRGCPAADMNSPGSWHCARAKRIDDPDDRYYGGYFTQGDDCDRLIREALEATLFPLDELEVEQSE